MKNTAIAIFSWILVGTPAALPAAPINFSTASDAGNTAPLWVAKDAGFFEKYGNTTQLIFIPGATVSISALLNNDVRMAQFSPTLAISSNAKGSDLVSYIDEL